ncbi:MAG TPA: hypothetical protein VFV72_15565 [Candidatus Limnocylindrales bacterium]|nr:hypothetical protein [Candidatus Limnocylindrales bacterium]
MGAPHNVGLDTGTTMTAMDPLSVAPVGPIGPIGPFIALAVVRFLLPRWRRMVLG